jgi:hypothetical protein
MKIIGLFNQLFLMVSLLIVFNNCSTEDTSTPTTAPGISTKSATIITNTTAECGGTITKDGGMSVTAKGVCWSTSQNPTISNNKTDDGSGSSAFTSTIKGLAKNTLYYVRAYAINKVGVGYGNSISFTTLNEQEQLPVVATTVVSSITKTQAYSGGTITSDGGGTITAKGVCWDTSQTPTLSNYKTTNGTGSGAYLSILSGLDSSTTYYVRAYATNSAGTAYGNILSFKTLDCSTPGNLNILVCDVSQMDYFGGAEVFLYKTEAERTADPSRTSYYRKALTDYSNPTSIGARFYSLAPQNYYFFARRDIGSGTFLTGVGVVYAKTCITTNTTAIIKP